MISDVHCWFQQKLHSIGQWHNLRKKTQHLCWKRLVKEDICLSFWNGPFFRWHVPIHPTSRLQSTAKVPASGGVFVADGWLLPREGQVLWRLKYRGVRNRARWSTWPSVEVRTPHTKIDFQKKSQHNDGSIKTGYFSKKTFHFLEALRNQRVENSTFVKHSKIPAVNAAAGPVLHPYSRSSLVRWDRCSIDIAEMASVTSRHSRTAWFPTTRTEKNTLSPRKKWYATNSQIPQDTQRPQDSIRSK